ncbi:MAG: glycosyltransferase [Bifidobacteriaceae bacterium]|jgi:glycosyltransferase involved in cell wall biosynthesis|nr:glycosyltransferase [Bifidobacteriaceae bacterium]
MEFMTLDSEETPLTIAMVMDTIGTQGNGTSNSALQYAAELEAQGHTVRIVGVGASEYRARIHHLPLVTWIASKQYMSFAQPSPELFDQAFKGVDVVHIYLPFKFGREALKAARFRHIPVTAAFHLQPENITYSAGVRYVPGIPRFLYWLFKHWLYKYVTHVHVPTHLGAQLLQDHGYRNTLHVISNGYRPIFVANKLTRAEREAAVLETNDDYSDVRKQLSVIEENENPTDVAVHLPRRFRILASGRLANEKDHLTLIKAVGLSKYNEQIDVLIAGTGPLRRRLKRHAKKLLANPISIDFHANAAMPAFLKSGDLFVHPSIADLESVSVIEAMATGLVPVIADSALSAAGQFALCDESSFPVEDAEALAERIDWWIEHPVERARWSRTYATHTLEHYSVTASVRKFVAMEREAIAEEE